MSALPYLWGALVVVGAWTVRPGLAPRALPVATSPAATSPRPSVLPVAAAAAAAALPLTLAIVTTAAVVAVPWLRRRGAASARRAAVVRSLPEVVDLVHLAVGAGLTVRLAVEAVVRSTDGPLAAELATALDEVALGRRLGDALADVPARTTDDVRPLVAALVESDRYGAPLADALARLAAEVRADRRRRAEEAARKVPVKLLFPLVCCVLPAFGLLTLTPLIAGAVTALRL